MLFLSLGSNYTFGRALRHLFAHGRKYDCEMLQNFLLGRYSGKKVSLHARGRGALSSAIRLATGGKGEVAVTSLTCYVVIEAIYSAGCEPLFVDCNSSTLHYDANALAKTIKGRNVRAVIVQNTLGIPVDIDAIMDVARKNNAQVIEDIAHAAGGFYDNGKEIGTVGDYTVLSFGRDKMLDVINGGALVVRIDKTKSKLKLATKSVSLVQQFRDKIYPTAACFARALYPIGFGKYVVALLYKTHLAVRSADGGTQENVKLPYWQAKVALEECENIQSMILKRLPKQQMYAEKLANFCPAKSSNGVRFSCLVENREEVLEALKKAGYYFEDVWYDKPVAPARLYNSVDFPEKDCPIAVELAEKVINLPTHQFVTEKDIDNITKIVQKVAKPWKQ